MVHRTDTLFPVLPLTIAVKRTDSPSYVSNAESGAMTTDAVADGGAIASPVSQADAGPRLTSAGSARSPHRRAHRKTTLRRVSFRTAKLQARRDDYPIRLPCFAASSGRDRSSYDALDGCFDVLTG